MKKKQKPKKPAKIKPHRVLELEKSVLSTDLIKLIRKPPKPKRNLRKILKEKGKSS